MMMAGASWAEMVSEEGLGRGARRMLTVCFCSFAGTGPGPDCLKRGQWGPSGWGERYEVTGFTLRVRGLECCLV